jgi:hypothetical protein
MFLALTALLTAPRSALCWAAKLKRFRECVEVVRNVSTNVSTAFHIGLSENRCGGPQPPSPFGRGLGVRRYGADLSKKCAPASRRDVVCQEFGLRSAGSPIQAEFSQNRTSMASSCASRSKTCVKSELNSVLSIAAESANDRSICFQRAKAARVTRVSSRGHATVARSPLRYRRSAAKNETVMK